MEEWCTFFGVMQLMRQVEDFVGGVVVVSAGRLREYASGILTSLVELMLGDGEVVMVVLLCITERFVKVYGFKVLSYT